MQFFSTPLLPHQFVLHREQYVSIRKTSRSMDCKETTAVYCENRMEEIHRKRKQNAEFLVLKLVVTVLNTVLQKAVTHSIS